MYTSTAVLIAAIDISIVQRVWKYQRDEWRSSADFRLYEGTHIRNVISEVTALKFTKFLQHIRLDVY